MIEPAKYRRTFRLITTLKNIFFRQNISCKLALDKCKLEIFELLETTLI